jgi:hypothetical protein
MTTAKHTTIVEADVSQALAAEARLQAATAARMEASKKLATMLDERERARIATLMASENAAKQALGARLEETRATKLAIAAAKEEEAAIKRAIAEERQREIAIRKTDAAAAQAAASARRASVAVAAIPAQGGGFVNLAGGIGSIVTGLGTLAAGAERVIRIADETASQSLKAQQVSANLQVSIGGAREAFKGYVDDIELARIANMAFELGVVKTGAELTDLAAGVQAKSERLGVSATELFDNAVTGIGRGSALILDNLGIILDQAKAEKIYADSLGKAVEQLTAYEKAQSFAKAATIEIAKAGKEASVSVDGLASSWRKATIDVTNFKSTVLGFDDSLGSLRENLRGLDTETLEKLAGGGVRDLQREVMGTTATAVSDWTNLLEAAAGIEDGWADSHENRLKAGETLRREASAALVFHQKEEAAATAAAAAAEQAAITTALNAEADKIDFEIRMAQARNATEAEIVGLQIQSLGLREQSADVAGDEAKALQLSRDALVLQATTENKKRSGGGRRRDPNEALDRETAATLRLLDAREKIYTAELESERDLDNVARSRSYLITLAREELDIREAAANSRKVKGADQIDKRDAELLEIATERRLLDVEVQSAAREEGRRHAEERLAEMDREIERHAAMGVAVQLLEQRRTQASVAMVAEFGTAQELRDAEHEQEIAKIETDRAYAESQAQGKLDAFTMEMETAAARGEQIYDIESRRLELEAQVAQAEGDHDKRRGLLHKRDVARIEERNEKLKRSTANANAMVGQAAAVFEMVNGRTVANEEKRAKAALRARGVEAIARGALETVESVAAFASLNVPLGILHAVAAGVAFTTGFPMIAGKEPGGGAAPTASTGGAQHQTVLGPESSGSSSSSSGSSGAPAVPPSAEALMLLRSGGSTTTQTTASKGGNVININGPIISGDAGTLLNDMNKQTLKKWGSP